MLFHSLEFIIFFPVVVAIYFLAPLRFRQFFLLLASYYFYMCWKAEYAVLILLSTGIDYVAALHMHKTSGRGNIFYEFPLFDILLPVGISFYTFQTLSYTIDVYRSEKTPERNFIKFALYVTFFPQLVAGPIERSTRLLPQFDHEHKFDANRVVSGLRLMLWGFFKKLVIADRLALYVNEVYNNPADYTGLPVIIATYFFAFQIYCDFSAYSDIAIGAARVLGFDLMKNFRQPYLAQSIGEFWKRWHISLSTWFRDYLYIPLGGNRVSRLRWYVNLMAVFLISGLWHGANWTFVVWGALHGSYFVLSLLTQKL
ncbi:MAG: MBOAT family protein, partial [Chlorobi bacterium CHB1]|nr:MBOAT family protein [Chlorobi bacterium CHB1]